VGKQYLIFVGAGVLRIRQSPHPSLSLWFICITRLLSINHSYIYYDIVQTKRDKYYEFLAQ